MHFQEIKDNYYSNILDRIKFFIPEFTSIFDASDGIYPILGDLGNFLIDNLKEEKILHKIMSFINEAIEKGGTDTENAIILQIFDKLYEENGDISVINSFLLEKNKEKLAKYFVVYQKNNENKDRI